MSSTEEDLKLLVKQQSEEIKRLKAALVNISTRHQDELKEQFSESQWLKSSLMECSNALHGAVSLLTDKKDADEVPKQLKGIAESAAKFNYENVQSACKCAICPPVSSSSTSSSSAGGQNVSNFEGMNIDSSDMTTSGKNSTGIVVAKLPCPKGHDETMSVFKSLKRDANGLYVLAPPSGLANLLQQR